MSANDDPRARDTREREAREALEGVRRDSESLGTSALARAGRRLTAHLSAQDAAGEAGAGPVDPIELWGRRIGRGLSVVGAVLLAWYLGVQLRLW